MHRAIFAAVAALLLGAACSASREAKPLESRSIPSPPPQPAQIGAWGIDLSARDAGARAGDDFYRYAIGHWLDTSEIPPDRTMWGTFVVLGSDAEEHVRTLVEGIPAQSPPGSDAQKVGDFYRTYLDTDAIERGGLAPARPALDAIAAARTPEDVARLFGRHDLPLTAPIGIFITVDDKDPDRYIVKLTQSGLGLPDREYYLSDDPALREIRDKYVAHIGRMLALAGAPNPTQQAHTVLDLETRVARAHWEIARRRERDQTYNLRSRAQLTELAPDYPWQEQLAAAGVDAQKEFVVREVDAIAALGKLQRQIPLAAWRSYLTYHLLEGEADVLPKAFDEERFDFYGHTLNGQPQQRERWKRGVAALDGALGEAVGKLYVERYFPPDSKQKMLALVENLRAAYAERMQQLPWMSATTKKAALEKLATFRPKIGYPDKWRDYSALRVVPGDALGNAARAAQFDWQRDVSRLGQPTDRDEWGMTPQTVNAYYNPVFNEIVFPAAILRPPFFDPNADPAVNYGAVGGVIGHEMGHGFDDQGAKSDARGVLRTWWEPQDEAAFKKLVDRLAQQYDAYTVFPDLKVNGRLTLGENIGDLGGLTVAYEAYHLSLKGRPAPVLDGLSGDQRFFLSWAQAWRTLYRDARLRTQVMSDPHSPPKFRVNGVVRNMDPWYAAFGVKPGDQLYLAPEERVRIW